MSIVVEQTFHPVGHGTFHTGRARYHGEPGSFSWVYDCGSKRRSTLAPAIQAFSRSLRGTQSQIDLLVISHFDDDHINGVESLLATFSVKWLALPYTDLASRLAQAAAVNDEPCSSSTALFQLDPVQWLAVRGLSDRVENLLFVEGGPAPDTPPEPEPQSDDPDWPRRPSSREDENRKRPAEREQPRDVRDTNLGELVTPLNTFGSAGAAAPRLALLQHSQPVQALGPDLEFMFYNSDQPDMCRTRIHGVRIARRSKAPLAQVEAEILQLTQQLQIGQPGVKPRRPWREKLRRAYDHHFGNSGQARNNISLCLMTRVPGPQCEPECPECTAPCCCGAPVLCAEIGPPCDYYGRSCSHCRSWCNYWGRPREHFCSRCGDRRHRRYGYLCRWCSHLYRRPGHGQSICSIGTANLCLGDLTVTSSTIDSMQRHFAHRWDALAAVQVPHHGSHHSWRRDNAYHFDPDLFIHCVPDHSSHHPHAEVNNDLLWYPVRRANYSQGVRILMGRNGRFKHWEYRS